MAKVAVPTAKASVFDTPEGLVINIPSAKNWFVVLFIGFWLCGWAFGEVSVIRQLATGKANGAGLFLLAWLGAWTVGGCAAIYFWLFTVAGHEIVSLTPPTSLAIRRDILGFGRSREYDLPSVQNLRIDNTAVNGRSTGGFSLPFGGKIAFDYGSKTFRFGAGVDEAEASDLIEVLKGRYPFDSPPR
jgi:hypothetical protein